MGFLNVFGIVLQFNESKQFFKIIKDNFVKYVIRELNKRVIVVYRNDKTFEVETELNAQE